MEGTARLPLVRIVLGLALIGSLMAIPQVAHATHEPNTYCSESGDVCFSTRMDEGKRKLRLGMAAEYFQHYTLCVIAPDESKVCKRFEVQQLDNGVYGDIVNWRRQFPDKGAGAYTVRWKQGGNNLSPKLGFHES